MRWVLFALITVHGLIHVMGFAKAFGFAEFPQFTGSISRAVGILWLAAAIGMLVTAVLFIRAPQIWWSVGLGAVVLSQTVIITSWSDAKYGTLANLLIVAGVVHAFAAHGPLSFRTQYKRAVESRSERSSAGATVAEADLAPLPEPVRRYLRVTGSVGQPRVRSVRASWRGRIRASPSDPWMEFTADQHTFIDEPARFFLMDARRGGMPVDVYHAFSGDAASMRVRLLSLIPLTHAAGPEFTRAETVTLFNDLCLLAPAGLIDPAIRWEAVDDTMVRAHYSAGSNTVSALLVFNDAGELVDFISDDRIAASSDGESFTAQRWSTPVEAYRDFRGRRVMSRGEGRWHAPEGEFVYIELQLLELRTNPATRGDPRSPPANSTP